MRGPKRCCSAACFCGVNSCGSAHWRVGGWADCGDCGGCGSPCPGPADLLRRSAADACGPLGARVCFFAPHVCLLRCPPRGGGAGAPHEEEPAAPAGTVTRTFAWRRGTWLLNRRCGLLVRAPDRRLHRPRMRGLCCLPLPRPNPSPPSLLFSIHAYLRTHSRNRRACDAPVVPCRWMAFSQPVLAVPCAAAAAVSSRDVKGREGNRTA
ncbi:uncharacterized protein Tco025E_09923 [Trypanosoma conorhini]|uniref:Uncharacterized protein n=1 Tax=Trypanosoma conorhini TaxID=83891 RepID=A0A422MRB6_9TRYP|nr:uncharacterized protein Tco025E_09923 [Trypanosoma conorhini]RNE95747.1 hypothetical protein Tco025E_09923 [Trypanosoma conorhini]